MAKGNKPQGILIAGKISFRNVLFDGGAADKKYCYQEAVMKRYTELFDNSRVDVLDYGDENWPGYVGVFDLTQLGANGTMGEVLPRWNASGVLGRMQQAQIRRALSAARQDPDRDLAHGAGANTDVALAGYEAAQLVLWAKYSQVITERMARLFWPHGLFYLLFGGCGGTGEGTAEAVRKDMVFALNTVLKNAGLREVTERQKAMTVIPICDIFRSYAYQVFDEHGRTTDRAPEIIDRSNAAIQNHKQILFSNGETNPAALDLILRESPGWMRRVINAQEDGNLPFGLVSIRAQTHRQLLRLAAMTLVRSDITLKKEVVWWTSEVVPASPTDAVRAQFGRSYERTKKFKIYAALPDPKNITEKTSIAKLTKYAAQYRRAQELFAKFMQQLGEEQSDDKDVVALRAMIEDGNGRINRLVAQIRQAAGQTGFYVWDWERGILKAVLGLKVSEVLAGVEKVLAPIPEFGDMMHLVGKGKRAVIREVFTTADGSARILFEMGSQWLEKPSFEDASAERTAEEISALVYEAMAEARKQAVAANQAAEAAEEKETAAPDIAAVSASR